MEQAQTARLTFLLAVVAGYCDTAAFVAGDAIFSAHVTGNFIVFAAQTLFGTDANAWVKLLTFPVFVTAVMTGGWVIEKATKPHSILLVESVLLTGCGITAYWLHQSAYSSDKTATYTIVMGVVFAMGLQNACGKLFAREVYGPTTMMTGNVTQAALDLGSLIRKGVQADVVGNLKKDAILVLGFLGGCFWGAVLGKHFGLSSILVPGILSIICYCFPGKKSIT